MTLLKKQGSKSAGLGPSSYTSIAQAFNKLGYDEREKLRVKIDKAYFVGTENLQDLTCHGVNIGTAYVSENPGKDFMQ